VAVAKNGNLNLCSQTQRMLPTALCLDETHGTINGGYIVRSISTPPVVDLDVGQAPGTVAQSMFNYVQRGSDNSDT
jgi:hypothetical protein